MSNFSAAATDGRDGARRGVVAALTVVALAGGLLITREVLWSDGEGDPSGGATTTFTAVAAATTAPATAAVTSTSSTSTTSTTTTVAALVDPASFGQPYGTTVNGLLTFRGNPTRSWYGTGPLPRTQPAVLWQYPGSRMCGESSEYGEVRNWCGTGWTGQPAVFERDGRTWVVFGAYDYKVHFVDAATGLDIIPPFVTGDLAKGNVTVDPDGYPLVYAGSRDNYLRVIAIDGAEPRELYRIAGRTPDRLHNDDWDGAPLVIGDHLLAGGENSWFVGYRLNRGYAPDGTVTVNPQEVFRVPGFDDELRAALGSQDPRRVSIEASVAVSGDTAWLNNSGGLLQGWDISSLRTGTGQVTRTFRYWTGDDSDASVVVDDEGYLYVGVEVDRANARAEEVGQMLKIDPRHPEAPVVWAVHTNFRVDDGVWTTPVVGAEVVFWTSKPGTIYAIDRASGAVLSTTRVPGPVLSSPVLVDGVLLQGDATGVLHAFDVADPRAAPVELWQLDIGANIESTPAVWNGRIYVGTRGGYFVCVGSVT